MAEYPYLTKTSAIKTFLSKVQETGIPAAVSQKHLASIGLASSNDRPLIPLFRALGFINQSGVPTEVYRSYKNRAEAKKVLARAILKAYSGLYATYPDAHKLDNETLANYFRTRTGASERTVSAIVNTFKTLCESADFGEIETIEEEKEPEKREIVSKDERKTRALPPSFSTPAITINIQLQLPITENEAVYEKLFASLRKNLLEPTQEEK